MTKDEAQALKTFKHSCTCGGFAHTMNGRPESAPHMTWCPQLAEHREWWDALHATQAAPAAASTKESA